MPKLERLDWIAPLSEGRGVTLTDDPDADRFLAEDSNALLLGVLYDSQFATRRAFAIPLRLRERLGHFDIERLAVEDNAELAAAFSSKPALHRFPNRNATLTTRLASVIIELYGGRADAIWCDVPDVDELGSRLMALPAFGVEKTNWTVGMLGRLGMIDLTGWETYRAPAPRTRKTPAPSNP